MKIIKGISLAFLVAALSISCKKETTEENAQTENVIPADAKLETASLAIEGMTCEIGCAKTIEDKLAHTNGVKEAKVDFEGKLATVTFDANQQNPESLKQIVEAVAGGDTYSVTETKLVAQ